MDTVFNARLLTYKAKETIEELYYIFGSWCWIINKYVTGYLFNEIKKHTNYTFIYFILLLLFIMESFVDKHFFSLIYISL